MVYTISGYQYVLKRERYCDVSPYLLSKRYVWFAYLRVEHGMLCVASSETKRECLRLIGWVE